MKRFLFCTALAALCAASLHARTWTSTDGKSIEAEFVRFEGDDKIVIKMKGKDFTVPVTKFSDTDQQWLTDKKTAEAEKIKEMVGRKDNVPIDTRLFPEWKDYLKNKNFRRASELLLDSYYQPINKGTAEDWLDRDFEKDTCSIYVPESYDGSEPYGLYVNIHSGKKNHLDHKWHALFDEMKIIAVGADKADNYSPFLRRISLSIDAMAMIERDYNIDPERRVIGGGSGGGHMAFYTAALFPEYFIGAISCAAQSYLPNDETGNTGHFPGITEKEFKRGKRKQMKWVVISGDKDYNYKEILETSKRWHANRMQYQFMDIKGMGHNYPSVENFRKALEWVGM